MAERTLRGAGLGAKTFEDEDGIEFAARVDIDFGCPNGHQFKITFAEEAELPTEWECPRCGQEATRADGVVGENKDIKPPRTHWDMLRERRTIPELESLLEEQLKKLRENI